MEFIFVYIVMLFGGVFAFHSAYVSQEDKDALQSCRGQCYNDKVMPCSCDSKCPIHNNCCHDFAFFCPQNMQYSSKMFGSMKGLDVICSHSGVFLISSCPLNNNTTSHQRQKQELAVFTAFKRKSNRRPGLKISSDFHMTSDWEGPSLDNNLDTTSSNSSVMKDNIFGLLKNNSILQILDYTPVTDARTGFTYRNYDTYLCNTINQPKSRPIVWSSERQVTNDHYNVWEPQNLQEFADLTTKERAIYLPPENLDPGIFWASCHPESIDTCPADDKLNDSSLPEKCSEFISYVGIKEDRKTMTLYNNIFCAQCNNRSSALPVHHIHQAVRNFQFSGILEVHEDFLSLKIASLRPAFRAWTLATCHINEDPNSRDGKFKCSAKCRKNKSGIVIFQGGFCFWLHILKFALFSERHPLNANDKMKMRSFVYCYFRKHMHYHIDDVASEITSAIRIETNQTFHIVKFSVFFRNTNFFGIDTANPNISIMDLEMLSKLHHKLQNDSQSILNIKSSNQHALPFVHTQNYLPYMVDYTNYKHMSGLVNAKPGRIVGNGTTSVCACSNPVKEGGKAKFSDCILACWEAPDYDDDQEKLETLEGSPCLEFLRDNAFSISVTTLPTEIMLAISLTLLI